MQKCNLLVKATHFPFIYYMSCSFLYLLSSLVLLLSRLWFCSFSTWIPLLKRFQEAIGISARQGVIWTLFKPGNGPRKPKRKNTALSHTTTGRGRDASSERDPLSQMKLRAWSHKSVSSTLTDRRRYYRNHHRQSGCLGLLNLENLILWCLLFQIFWETLKFKYFKTVVVK